MYMPIKLIKDNFNNTSKEHSLYLPPKPRYGRDAHALKYPDSGNPLLKPDMKYIQCMIGSLFFMDMFQTPQL